MLNWALPASLLMLHGGQFLGHLDAGIDFTSAM